MIDGKAGHMKISIKQIAQEAHVSTATVSNALNRTRYVSPELAERIFETAQRLGYYDQDDSRFDNHALRVGKQSEIAFIVPDVMSTFFSNLLNALSKACQSIGYTLSIYLCQGDSKAEKHIISEVLANRKVAGIFLCPSLLRGNQYKKLLASDKPFVCIDREIEGAEIDCVLSNNMQGIRDAMHHLIQNGHERIALLLEDRALSTTREQREGYVTSLKIHDIDVLEPLILNVPLSDSLESRNSIKQFIRQYMPSAILAAGNTLTLRCLKSIDEMGLTCPKNISVVGFGDNEWCGLISPALTALTQNAQELARNSLHLLIDKIDNPQLKRPAQKILVPMDFVVRESTSSIACGPFGEQVSYPEEIALTPSDIQTLKEGHYSIAISLHNTNTEWSRLHELAIKESMASWGVRILAVTDANFDAKLQNTQLDSLIMQSPDALIAICVDENTTAAKFKEISQKTKLVLINNVPKGLTQDDFASWISVNEKENGQAAAKVLCDHFHENGKQAKIGMLIHGTPFFCTKQRDFFAERCFNNDKGSVQIVAKKSFYTIENAYNACKEMFMEHPEINGLYITWDRPALQAIRALKELGRTDVAVTTTDLDYEIASYIAKGEMVIGLSSQRPYEQGKAVATATARALLGKTTKKCIGVLPFTVRANNLEKAWKDILHVDWDESRP